MTSRRYDAIDETVEAETKRLKEEHPDLGHEGLMDALAQQGIELDEAEFKKYVRTHKLAPGIKQQSWGWVGEMDPLPCDGSSPPARKPFLSTLFLEETP